MLSASGWCAYKFKSFLVFYYIFLKLRQYFWNILHLRYVSNTNIRSLRYPVASILEYLAAGDTIADILAEFSDLEKDDILACLAFAALAVNAKGSGVIIPVAA